ncbi:hypothetical protein KQX54_000325, partial [Cotesia glomerata]
MLLCSPTIACPPALPDHRYFLTKLPESQQINTLALIGSHDSATYNTLIFAAQIQQRSITEQLNAGIRVLDIRVRRIENVSAIHHDSIYLGMMFGDIVNEVWKFLRRHPYEFVIMFLQDEFYSESSTMSECEILENRYIKIYGNLFVQFWPVEDTIKEHHGKILLARGNNGFGLCTVSLHCDQQNLCKRTSTFTRTAKWNAIAAFQDKIFNANSSESCYINYLPAHGGIIGPNTIDNKFWSDIPEFLGTGLRPGMNYRMIKYFRNPKNTLYIIMADNPLPQLLDKM